MKPEPDSHSRCLLMIVLQKSTQPIQASHWHVVVRFVDSMEQQQVVLTLVISLCMIVRNIVLHRPPQGAFAKGNDLRRHDIPNWRAPRQSGRSPSSDFPWPCEQSVRRRLGQFAVGRDLAAIAIHRIREQRARTVKISIVGVAAS
jgi:hypothetical protein